MTVYIDIVLFENILLNYIILLATAIISKSKINSFKILLASMIGGIYAILNYIAEITTIVNIIIKVVMSIIIVMIAFDNKKLKSIVKQTIFFYLVSFTFGGITFMLLFFINPENIVIKENHLVGTYPLKVVIWGGVIGFIIISIVSKIIKDRMNKKALICDLEIFYKGNIKKVKTMIDTGNLLKEPITQTDVIIVEKDSLKEIVEKDILDNLDNILKGKWLEKQNCKIHEYHFKVIPFMSLGNENGMLIGFKPDYIKIYDEEENVRTNIIIAIYDGKLSKTNLYTSLIGLDVLKKGEKKNEFAKNA